jgi:hypothetical protein
MAKIKSALELRDSENFAAKDRRPDFFKVDFTNPKVCSCRRIGRTMKSRGIGVGDFVPLPCS